LLIGGAVAATDGGKAGVAGADEDGTSCAFCADADAGGGVVSVDDDAFRTDRQRQKSNAIPTSRTAIKTQRSCFMVS